MKTNLLPLFAAVGFALTVTSCVPFDPAMEGGYGSSVTTYRSGPGYYSSPGYSYNDDDFYYYDGGAYPSYYNRPYGSYTVGYSYYRGSALCPICHHNPCSGHSGRANSWRSSSYHRDYDHDHDDHRSYSNYSHSSGSTRSNGPVLYQHSNADRNSGAPQGAHTKEWFTSRGYSTARLEKADDDRKSSSSHHSSKKDDDDHRKNR